MANLNPGKLSGQIGGSVPKDGESEIRQQSSAVDLLTLTGSTGPSGNLLVLRLTTDVGSTADSQARFVVNSSGEQKTSYRNVTALTSAATQTIGSSLSGGILTYGPSSAAKTITLPAPVPGLNYTIYGNDAGVVGPTIITSVGSTGSWKAVGDTATDGISLSSVVVVQGGVYCFALNSTKWAAVTLIPGSSLSLSSGTAWASVSS